MLAAASTPPPLVCTIQTVESRWRPKAIAGIRRLEQQSFRLIRGSEGARVEPPTVIESRLTSLVQRFRSSGLKGNDPGRLLYRWSFEAPLGTLGFDQEPSTEPVMVEVTGHLVIRDAHRFELVQRSRLIGSGREPIEPETILSTLSEVASGVCDGKR